MTNLYYAIVGTTTNTNAGLGRFMGLVIVFILAGGTAYSVEMILCFTFDGDRLSRIGFFVDGFDTGGRK